MKTAGSWDAFLFTDSTYQAEATVLSTVINLGNWLVAGDVDITCIPIRIGSIGFGCLISPSFILAAAHTGQPGIGAVVTFIDSNGSVVTRTVIAVTIISGTDILVSRLNSPVPAGVTPAKILPAAGIAKTITGAVVCGLHQDGHLSVYDLGSLSTPTTKYAAYPNSQYGFRSRWGEPIVGGDSGYPVMGVVGSSVVAVTANYTSGFGPSYAAYNSEIEAVLSGAGEAPTYLDVSGYT